VTAPLHSLAGLASSVAAATLPPSAQLWQNVWNWYFTLGLASGIATFAVMAYVLVRYRSRAGRELAIEKTREERETWRGPLVLFALMAIVLTVVAAQTFMALPVYMNAPQGPGDLDVKVTAQQFFFTFTYPNNKSSNLLIVPINTVIVLNVTSKDVNHQFGIPDFRVKTDAIPGRYNTVWIEPNSLNNYTIQCFELCGIGHATMITKMVVLTSGSFDAWYNSSETR
jgi:cytochrome c oxidase subunit II